MKQRSVLLLGGGGFLGTSLAKFLFHKGWNVHIISHHLSVNINEFAVFHQGGMEDKSLIEVVLPECEVVIHLASGTTPGSSAGKPLNEADINIVPTLEFLNIFKNSSAQQMIYISSGGTLYGNPETVPVNEQHPLQPLSYHGAGKIAIEAFVQAFAHDTGKQVTILRPSNLYGPGQSLRDGFGFIRNILEHLRKNTEMEVWGNGETVRDFLYIQDIVKSIELIINSEPHTDVYNVGSGIGYSLNAVIKTVEGIVGKSLKTRYLSGRQVDVQKVVLDCSKIKRKLAWEPEISLEEGIYLTWQWISKPMT